MAQGGLVMKRSVVVGGDFGEIKKPSKFGVAGGGKYPRLRILGLGFI